MKRWKGNVTNSAYDAEGKFYLADEAQAEIAELVKFIEDAEYTNSIDRYRSEELIAKHRSK